MKTNQRKLGYCRDNAILKAIDDYGALETEQVRALHFPFPAGLRKAQQRLKKLFDKRRIDRDRIGEVYAYWRDKRPGLIKHLIGTNWIRLWFEKRLKSWEKLHSWEYEQDYGVLRCDGFAAIKNLATGKYSFYFIEFDRGTNAMDKIEKYNYLYSSGGYGGRWWVKLTNKFPTVLIVTLTATRAKEIHERIRHDNKEGLRFEVKLLEEVKKEVSLCKA